MRESSISAKQRDSLAIIKESFLRNVRPPAGRQRAPERKIAKSNSMHRVEVVRLILLIFFCIPRSLNECRLRFISVTSSLAGAERADATPDEHARFAADVKKVIDAFFEQTSWCPNRVKPVAGALLYTKYNFLIRFVMKRIARKAGAATDTSRDHEQTKSAAVLLTEAT